MDIRFFALIPLLFFLATGCSSDKSSDNGDPKGRILEYSRTVTFLDTDGDSVTSVEVAVADNQQERNEGLMDVNNLPRDKGMLFIFENQQPLSFWMANTPLSLDIIFINEAMEIVRIHQRTQPFSQKSVTSGEPARYVVEVNGGFCLTHDIQQGMKVTF